MQDKVKAFESYKGALTREGIKFSSNPMNYTINIYMKDSCFNVYTSKNWWENRSLGIRGNGIMSLLRSIKDVGSLENRVQERSNFELQSEYNKQNFIMRFLTKNFYKKLMKDKP